MSAAIVWTDEWTSQLIQLRKGGASYLECAEVMGMSALPIQKKCQLLGINQKMNVGRISARQALKEADTTRAIEKGAHKV